MSAGKTRCGWAGEDPDAIRYHDEEWGTPTHDDRIHFEFLVLESAQAGLSWITILRKREAYRTAYDGFDPSLVARYGEEKVQSLLADAGIVRNRRKIDASINNARRFIEIQREYGSFDAYLWSRTDGAPITGGWSTMAEVPVVSELSDRLSADMKKRGFTFIGSTIIYSYLQALGVINDHVVSCFRYRELNG